jgi:hypothetical protein
VHKWIRSLENPGNTEGASYSAIEGLQNPSRQGRTYQWATDTGSISRTSIAGDVGGVVLQGVASPPTVGQVEPQQQAGIQLVAHPELGES